MIPAWVLLFCYMVLQTLGSIENINLGLLFISADYLFLIQYLFVKLIMNEPYCVVYVIRQTHICNS